VKAHERHPSWSDLEQKLDALSAAMRSYDISVVRIILQQVVDGYQPIDDVVDWVSIGKKVRAEGGV
jgi:hypothetical protein